MSESSDQKPPGSSGDARGEPLHALLDTARALAKQKRWAEALHPAQRALALAPNEPSVAALAGQAHFHLGHDREAVALFAQVLAHDDQQSAIWHLSSVSLLRLGRASDAYAHAERACALAPERDEFAWQRRAAAAAGVPDWHFNMVNDEPRNAAFAAAIAALVEPEHVVLEIGAGSALLAMLAARDEHGQPRASEVVTCETNPLLARAAAAIVQQNGLAERVRVIARHSSELELGRDLSRRADLLLCEIFSVQVLAEGVLPSLEDAKARLLAPSAKVIPALASARAALVSSEALARRVRVSSVHGFDLTPLNAFSPIVQYVSSEQELTLLSEPFDVFRFDLANQAVFPAEKRSFSVEAQRAGRCEGVIQWLRLELAPGIVYENRPGTPEGARSRHWHPVFYPFPSPLELSAGQRVTLRASHNRSALRVTLAAEPR